LRNFIKRWSFIVQSSRLTHRLGVLSHSELLELAAGALDALPQTHRLRSRADALVAQRKPLPSRCVDGVLLSPDLLPHLVESLSLRDCTAAAACSMWAGEWAEMLRRRRYVHPVPRSIVTLRRGLQDDSILVGGITVMPDDALCVNLDEQQRIRFMTAECEPMPSAWVALANAVASQGDQVFTTLLSDDSLFVLEYVEEGGAPVEWEHAARLRRLRLNDGIELARSPMFKDPYTYDCDPKSMAVAGHLLLVPTVSTVSVFDVQTLELRYTFGAFGSALDCAVHGDEVFVADHDVRGQLEVFGLDGQHRRTACGDFGTPYCISIRDDRIYMIECVSSDEDPEGRRLLVLELNGQVRQDIRVPEVEYTIACFCFRGDELLVCGCGCSSDDGKTVFNKPLMHVFEFCPTV